MRLRILAVFALLGLLAGACGDDDGDTVSSASSTSSSSPAQSEDLVDEDSDADDDGEDNSDNSSGDCPDQAPIPSGVSDLAEAPKDFDGDGDGSTDVLSVFSDDDGWWLHAEWASGGTAVVSIEDASGMGAWPLGGYDLDGDGNDEAFVAISGPASGVLVGVYHRDGCELAPVTFADSGDAFMFPVTASVGAFSGASCESIGDISLINGELLDPEVGEYEASEVPHTYDPATGEITAGFGDGGSANADEVGFLASLNCGDLADAL